jgi:hypothetical protein
MRKHSRAHIINCCGFTLYRRRQIGLFYDIYILFVGMIFIQLVPSNMIHVSLYVILVLSNVILLLSNFLYILI